MIASWPGNITPGVTTDHISAHYDLPATFSELLGFEMPDTDGISFLPTLLGEKDNQTEHEFLYWEFPPYGGQVAIRMGDWKVIRRNLNHDEPPTLELYNLNEDITEQHNLAGEYPEILRKAAAIFENEHQQASQEGFRIPLLEQGLLAEPGDSAANR
jgi:arylsulfatase